MKTANFDVYIQRCGWSSVRENCQMFPDDAQWKLRHDIHTDMETWNHRISLAGRYDLQSIQELKAIDSHVRRFLWATFSKR